MANFPELFKANLVFKYFSRQPFIFKYFSSLCEPCKGHNSVKILRKMMGNNPKLDLVNVDVHTKFGQILSICSQDFERKRNSDVNQGS